MSLLDADPVAAPAREALLLGLGDPGLPRAVYKPFGYPWAYDAWLIQQRIHWLPEEVPLADDVKSRLATEPDAGR